MGKSILILHIWFNEVLSYILSTATFYFGMETRLEGSVRPEKVGRIIVKNNMTTLPDESKYTLQITATDNAPPDEQLRATCIAIITVSKGVIDPKPKYKPGTVSIVHVSEVKNNYNFYILSG